MIAFLFIFLLALPFTAPAATLGHSRPVALTVLHTADGQGEISPCG